MAKIKGSMMSLLLLSVLGFGLFLVYGFLFMKLRDIAAAYRFEYILNTAILNFAGVFPAIALFTVLSGVGFPTGETRLRSFLPPTIAIILLATIAHGMLHQVAVPAIRAKNSVISAISRQYEVAMTELPKAIKAKDRLEAERHGRTLRILDAKGKEAILLLKDLEKLRLDVPVEDSQANQSLKREEMSLAADYYRKALDFFSKEDWYSAHYYFSRAFSLDPSRGDAQRLAAETEDRIALLGLSSEDRQRRNLAAKKIDAYQSLMSGDHLRAYALFSELLWSSPDAEIRRYAAEAEQKLRTSAFYLEEMDDTLPITLGTPFAFAIDEGKSVLTVCQATSITHRNHDLFFTDFRMVRMESDKVTASLEAPFAKLHESPPGENGKGKNTLYFRAVNKTNPSQFHDPVIVGKFPQNFDNLFDVPFSTSEVLLASKAIAEPEGLDILSMPDAMAAMEKLRRDPAPIALALAERITSPLAMLTLLFFGIPVGWALRSPKPERPSLMMRLASVVIVAALIPACEIWFWANGYLVSVVREAIPGGGYIPAVAGAYALLVAAIVVFTAGRRDSRLE